MIGARAGRHGLALLGAIVITLAPIRASAKVGWIAASRRCEPPSVFYTHVSKPKGAPCTPLIPGVCPYGGTCSSTTNTCSNYPNVYCGQTCPAGYTPNAAGRCVSATACDETHPCAGTGERCLGGTCVLDVAVPPAIKRPNVILFVADDQAYCSYGSSRECRTPNAGAPILSAYTPNLDALAAHGTVFPLTQMGAAICAPSRATILTGRNYRHLGTGKNQIPNLATLANSLRQLGGAGGVPDPFDCETEPAPSTACVHRIGEVVPADFADDETKTSIRTSVIGGYATFIAGKGAPTSPALAGFHAVGEGPGVGRTPDCGHPTAPLLANGELPPPQCGTGSAPNAATCLHPDTEPYYSGCRYPAEAAPASSPIKIVNNETLYGFIDALVYPTPAGGYDVQNFFAWYAPKMPHEPVTPDPKTVDYLFGPTLEGGVFPNLVTQGVDGRYSGLGTPVELEGKDPVTKYYGMIWWVDDAVREIRKYLAAGRCITRVGGDGPVVVDWTKTTGTFVGTPAAEQCTAADGTWTDLGLADNTIIIYVADHGRFLPDAKRRFSNNGYDSNLIVYDPRAVTSRPAWYETGVPAWKGGVTPTPPMTVQGELTHAVDLLPTIVGFGLNETQPVACPQSAGTGQTGHDARLPRECFGRDLRPYLGRTAPSPPLPPLTTAPLRGSLCGHRTKNGGDQRQFYALAKAGVCRTSGGTLIIDPQLGPSGAPRPCLDETDCPGTDPQCDRTSLWCANDVSGMPCTSDAECAARPPCEPTDVACLGLCQPRLLKLYASATRVVLTDLFLDPDEGPEDNKDLIETNGANSPVATRLGGTDYQGLRNRLQGCVSDWTAPDDGIAKPAPCPDAFVCDEAS